MPCALQYALSKLRFHPAPGPASPALPTQAFADRPALGPRAAPGLSISSLPPPVGRGPSHDL